ncbi:hypothetical protein [Ramlibacter sp.]|uniref:hypothetical protein n=1 Tax=Ramlibacter sp. TaxID=1917967 RepID=UPI003D11D2AF
MNRQSIATFVAIAAFAGASFAYDDVPQHDKSFTSTASRAAVAAEATAQPRGPAYLAAIQYSPYAGFQGTKTRAEVQADLYESRERMNAFTGEDSGSRWLSRNGANIARTNVVGEPVNPQ